MSTFANDFFASIGLNGYRGAIEPEKLRDPKFYTARTKRAVNSRGAL